MIISSPIGPMRIHHDGDVVCAATFLDAAEPQLSESEVVRACFERYFAGELNALNALEVRAEGTEFQKRVWAALREIPAGQTRSYGEIAEDLGSVARAVGGANGANPVAVIVPCHRVIGQDGTLTGYAGGMERKEWLLNHEAALRSKEERAHKGPSVAGAKGQGPSRQSEFGF